MLFTPFSFFGLHLKNRIIRSATCERMAEEDGFVGDSIIKLYTALTCGGSGLTITGNTLIHPSGWSSPRMLCIHSDIYVSGLRRLTDEVHRLGGIIAVQLSHGGRQCPSILLGGDEPIAPSSVYDPVGKVLPKEMTDFQIWEIIDAFASAGRRAVLSGFDAIQIHGAHGFLISSFLSPHTNRRDDYWGGDEERRFHFLEEVYKAIRKEVGDTYPILIKLNVDDLLPEGAGLKPSESLRISQRLEEMGINAIELSGGMRESPIRTIRPDIKSPLDEAYFREEGRLFKQSLTVPVILTGGIRSREVMEDVLMKKEADIIGMSRPLIREPDLPLLLKEGKEKADCISCNKCIKLSRYEPIRCLDKEHAL